jgi:ankyrin repeat protein
MTSLWSSFAQNNISQVITDINDLNVDDLLTKCVNPQTNRPLLHEAACKGHYELVRHLIEDKGVPVDSRDTTSHLITALHMASREGHENIVRYLLNHNANVNLQDRDGYTALHYASINGNMSIVQYLISLPDINVNLTDTQSRTALHRAIEHNKSAVAHELIIKTSIDINIQNNHGWTALHYASYQENRGLCEMLITHGANTNLKDRDDHAPLFWGYGTWHDEEGGCTCPKPHK